jgi:hypothetical protein
MNGALAHPQEPGRSANIPMPGCNLLKYSHFRFLGVEDELEDRGQQEGVCTRADL